MGEADRSPLAAAGVAGVRTLARPARLTGALPSLRIALGGAALWAAVMAASASIRLLTLGWKTTPSIVEVSLLFALGAAVAFPLAYVAAGLIAGSRGAETRLAAALLAFTTLTIGVTAGFYALNYRLYYAHWHDEPFSVVWFLQFAFTTAGALVQFAVSATRLYFPLGFAALLAAAWWFARQRR